MVRRIAPLTVATAIIAAASLLGCRADTNVQDNARYHPPTTRLPADDWPEPPSLLYPGLFQEVAMAGVVDAKDWVDAVPRRSVAEIMQEYRSDKPQDRQALREFVLANFDLPDNAPEETLPTGLGLRDHIEALWPILTRESGKAAVGGSLIALPNPYVVPGGRFREVYYWDSYFTMLGLGEAHAGLRQDMVDNFAFLIDRFGFVPNANRTYYLSRSQPPFFFAMVGLLADDQPAMAYSRYLDQLRAEHAFWNKGGADLAAGEASGHIVRLDDGAILNRYWDSRDVPRDESYRDDVETASHASRDDHVVYRTLRATAESGWDFSSRWFGEGGTLSSTVTLDIIPADLNSLLYGLERAIEQGCRHAEQHDCVAQYGELADQRRKAMNTYLWDEDRGAFSDYDLTTHEHRTEVTAAIVYPLYFGIASDDQAFRTAQIVEAQLLAPGGLLTTLVDTDQQWDNPNGWAPLHWLAVSGLSAYGEDDLARTIAHRWLDTVARTYCTSGKMVEKYDVVTARPAGGGEYPLQDGFGWSNGVTIALLDRYPELSQLGAVKPNTSVASDTQRMSACELELR